MSDRGDTRVPERGRRAPDRRERPPIWKNTRPRGNPEPDRHDLARSVERFQALLGR
jgi:hypothetical protein